MNEIAKTGTYIKKYFKNGLKNLYYFLGLVIFLVFTEKIKILHLNISYL